MAYQATDQKAECIAHLLMENTVFWSPRYPSLKMGYQFIIMVNERRLWNAGNKKLNTTTSHPQCDGAVERFNRALKTMIKKYVVKFGVQ